MAGSLSAAAGSALDERAEPYLLGVADALLKCAEPPSLEEVREVDGVSGLSQCLREPADAGGQPVPVVEDEDLSYIARLVLQCPGGNAAQV